MFRPSLPLAEVFSIQVFLTLAPLFRPQCFVVMCRIMGSVVAHPMFQLPAGIAFTTTCMPPLRQTFSLFYESLLLLFARCVGGGVWGLPEPSYAAFHKC